MFFEVLLIQILGSACRGLNSSQNFDYVKRMLLNVKEEGRTFVASSQNVNGFPFILIFCLLVCSLSVIGKLLFLQVTCSYLQIYQERIYDLLGTDKSGPEIFLREHPRKGMIAD